MSCFSHATAGSVCTMSPSELGFTTSTDAAASNEGRVAGRRAMRRVGRTYFPWARRSASGGGSPASRIFSCARVRS